MTVPSNGAVILAKLLRSSSRSRLALAAATSAVLACEIAGLFFRFLFRDGIEREQAAPASCGRLRRSRAATALRDRPLPARFVDRVPAYRSPRGRRLCAPSHRCLCTRHANSRARGHKSVRHKSLKRPRAERASWRLRYAESRCSQSESSCSSVQRATALADKQRDRQILTRRRQRRARDYAGDY